MAAVQLIKGVLPDMKIFFQEDKRVPEMIHFYES